MSRFVDALAGNRFLVTTEEPPPKGADTAPFLRRTQHLVGLVDAVNLTEASAAVMTMSPAGLLPGLIAQGHAPILQLTCRDRNRIALQAEVLAASALGCDTIVAMTGDPVAGGDHPDAVGVHDVETTDLIRMIDTLNTGVDATGNPLHGTPQICIGAVVNPDAGDLDSEVARMEQKVEAGARFFQTQAVYEPHLFARFMTKVEHLGVPVIATYIVPKSAGMARRMNSGVPGVHIPDQIIKKLEDAQDPVSCSLQISAGILRELATMCSGVHLIGVGWEARFAALLTDAGIAGQPA